MILDLQSATQVAFPQFAGGETDDKIEDNGEHEHPVDILTLAGIGQTDKEQGRTGNINGTPGGFQKFIEHIPPDDPLIGVRGDHDGQIQNGDVDGQYNGEKVDSKLVPSKAQSRAQKKCDFKRQNVYQHEVEMLRPSPRFFLYIYSPPLTDV